MNALLLLMIVAVGSPNDVPSATSSAAPVNCYVPIQGGWRIRIAQDGAASSVAVGSRIGVVQDDPRLHRRPLFPPADRSMIWTPEEMKAIQRCGFRPLIVAYNGPRFLLDYHSAGGLLGHLQIGLADERASKWFHEWSDIEVSYVYGRMEYVLRDAAFPGVAVTLAATALADSAGLIVKVSVEGGGPGARLVWAYGGASAFFTNYAMNAPEFAFSPGQCAKDRVAWSENGFVLRRRFDESDVYMKEPFAVARYLPDWEAVIRGNSSWRGQTGLGDPAAFAGSPKALCENTDWENGTNEKTARVIVQSVPLEQGAAQGFIVLGMGGDIEQASRNPDAAWQAALARNSGIAGRVVTETPDPYLDAAVTMMAFATEGTWGDLSILHGGWSWRFAYLGWRGWYGSTCYGWTDRVKRSIENHTTLGLIREGSDAGALGSLLESSPGVYYNMDEVFLDQVRQYFDYTNDVDLMRTIFPILKGILEWEDRRLRPKDEDLYENALNTWISDSHWYTGGQCTQASAYMLRANTFLADLAERLGEDSGPYYEKVQDIRWAMQDKLWMPDKGVFAEYLDTRGNGLLHPEPELPTIYHSAEFGAADGLQIAQMLGWADTHLRTEHTPGDGKLVWSSNWFPNRGRTYTHSTYELAYGEELNFALTNYLGGRADEAYALIRATLCGIFNGPTPGGLACHTFVDGRQRANDEFADAISMWGRAITEGLFGIVPKRPDGVVHLTPQFPKDWREASIATPAFSYQWRREGTCTTITWSAPVETKVRLRVPMRGVDRKTLRVDGNNAAEVMVETGPFGLDRTTSSLLIDTPPEKTGRIELGHKEEPIAEKAPSLGTPSPSSAPPKPWRHPETSGQDLAQWALVNLTGVFNASVTDVLKQVSDKAEPPPLPASQVGFGYWKDHLLQYHGSRNEAISDAAWRAKVGGDGIAWTTEGIPFRTAKEGSNIGVVTLAGGFPKRIEFPIGAPGKVLYLMLSGMTFPVQSHVVNLRVTLRYADGEVQQKDLISPFDIGDCWSTWCGRYHDTPANGFENIGGRTGPTGSAECDDLSNPIALDTEAQLAPFDLRPNVPLAAVAIEAIANDVIFGVMGASILK